MLVRDLACPFRFAEHDVFIPMVALEETDAKKSPPGVCRPRQGRYSDRGGHVERWSRRSARATDYRKAGRGAHARNREQNFALNLLLGAYINLASL